MSPPATPSNGADRNGVLEHRRFLATTKVDVAYPAVSVELRWMMGQTIGMKQPAPGTTIAPEELASLKRNLDRLHLLTHILKDEEFDTLTRIPKEVRQKEEFIALVPKQSDIRRAWLKIKLMMWRLKTPQAAIQQDIEHARNGVRTYGAAKEACNTLCENIIKSMPTENGTPEHAALFNDCVRLIRQTAEQFSQASGICEKIAEARGAFFALYNPQSEEAS